MAETMTTGSLQATPGHVVQAFDALVGHLSHGIAVSEPAFENVTW